MLGFAAIAEVALVEVPTEGAGVTIILPILLPRSVIQM